MRLKDVMSAYQSPDKKTSLQAALGKVTDLEELMSEASTRKDELSKKSPEELTDDDVAELQGIAEVIKTARAQRAEAAAADAAKSERAAKAAAAAASISDLVKSDPEPQAEAKPVDTQPADIAPAEAVAVPDQPQEAAVEAPPTKELVGAGVGQFRAVSSLTSPPPPVKSLQGRSLSRMFSVDSGGQVTNRKYDSMEEVSKAITANMQSRMGVPGKTIIAQYKREQIEEFNVLGRDSDLEVIENVAAKQPIWDPTAGQFAAGWCAPSQTLYELCPWVTSLDGIIDLPEVVATRGGVQTTRGPDFATLFADSAIGQVLTEAEVIAGTPKECIEIDCPPFVDTRLDVNPLCITGNLLTQAGYPEYNERFIRMAVAANAHKINLDIILRMVAASTAVTLPGATGPVDTSSASWFLDAASRYATWLRDRYRLDFDALIEVVAPRWYLQQMVSDLARRTGVDLLVSEARLREAFASRNIRVQWVYDWQPMAATAAGAAAGPLTAQILVYIPGTFVKLTSPVINLGTIYSPAQLTLNQYTAMFVEDGFNVLERCFESLVLTVPTCPSGTTGAASGTCDITP